MGTPSHHPFLDRIFHEINHAFGAAPMTMETPISHSPGGFDVIHGHDWLVGPAVNQLANMNKRVPASDSWPLHNEQPWLTSIHVFLPD